MTNTNVNKIEKRENNKEEKQETNVANRISDHLNYYQKLHLLGQFNVYEPIPQKDGEPLPPLAVQWKEDAKRRFKNANSSNR
jgi:hypothetical protein